MHKIYFSADIETNGLVPGINSMISLGIAAINMSTGNLVATRKWNISPVDDLRVDPETMNWWKGFPEAYKRATDNAMSPYAAIPEFANWVKYVSDVYHIKHPVLACWKPGFDAAFIRYYLHRFGPGDIFGRGGSGLDIKTLACIALNKPFSEVKIGEVPVYLKGGYEAHTHDALDDAIEQAHVLYNAVKQLGVNL